MIEFACPVCSAKCTVDDSMSGRKMRCPKCRTRIRHHRDGTLELLSRGEPPPPAPAPAAPAAPAPSAPPPASPGTAPKDSTVAIAAVPEMVVHLVSQSESRQNTLIVWGIVGFLALVLSGVGLASGEALLIIAPPGLVLTAGFVWLGLRYRRKWAKAREARAAKKAAHKGEASTAPPAGSVKGPPG